MRSHCKSGRRKRKEDWQSKVFHFLLKRVIYLIWLCLCFCIWVCVWVWLYALALARVPTYLHWSRFSLIQHQCRTGSICLGKLPLCACPVLSTNLANAHTQEHVNVNEHESIFSKPGTHQSKSEKLVQICMPFAACRLRKSSMLGHQCWEVPGKNVVFHANQCPTINCMVEKGWWNRINIFGFRLPIFHIRSSISGTHWELQLSHWLQNNSLLKTRLEDLLLCLHKTG